MRYLIPVLALLALSCRGGEEKAASEATSTGTAGGTEEPSAAPVFNLRDSLLRPEDVPPELIPVDGSPPLSEPQLLTAEEFFAGQLAAGQITADDVGEWGVAGAAAQSYTAPFGISGPGVEFLQVTVLLHEGTDGARSLFAFPKTVPDRSSVEALEAGPGRVVVLYEEVAAPAIGDESRLIHFVSENQNEPGRVESFMIVMRRDRVVAMMQVRDEEGVITADDVRSIAMKLDDRIVDGLKGTRGP